jgi:RimJ/RimL family protein N-acetyltransferase
MTRRRMIASSCAIGPPDGLGLSLSVREPTPNDREPLAALMLEAYRGTIDFDGDETLEIALNEVDSFFAGRSGPPLVEHSRIALDGDAIVSVSLISLYEGLPLVAYTYTDPAWKGRGAGTALLRASMASVCAGGFDQIGLFVTPGNQPAESIYERLGFVDVAAG